MSFRILATSLLALMAASCVSPGNQGEAMRASAIVAGPQSATLNGVTLHYRVAGRVEANVPPVIFLHGGPGGNTYTFEQTAGRLLERDWPIVYLEQRGSGKSERPNDGNYAISTLADDVEALRLHLGAPQVSLIAHSFGTAVALDHAARYPDSVASVVIVGGLSNAPESCREGAVRLKQLHPDVYARVFPDGADVVSDTDICDRTFRAFPGRSGEAYRSKSMFADAAAQARFEAIDSQSGITNTGEIGNYLFRNGLLRYRFDRFDALKARFLVISGLHDWAAGPASQRALAARLPRSRLIEYPDAGHWSFVDKPETFAADVDRFLRLNLKSNRPM